MDESVSAIGAVIALVAVTVVAAIVVGMWAGAIWQLVVWGWELVQV